MKCDAASITHWLGNEMSAAERKEFEIHLSACSDCCDALNIAEKFTGKLLQTEIPEPSADMDSGFQAMLGDYKKLIQRKETRRQSLWSDLYEKLTTKPVFQLGYSLILVLAGVGITYLFPNSKSANDSQKEVAQLSSEIREMKELMMLSLLENPSATERLKAVSYTEEINTANEPVIEALLTTLNEDPNVNVRLVTLEALMKYSDNTVVRQGLVQAIRQQESPLMQSALADAMMKLQEKKSIAPFRKLLQDKTVSDPIKTKIQHTINMLNI